MIRNQSGRTLKLELATNYGTKEEPEYEAYSETLRDTGVHNIDRSDGSLNEIHYADKIYGCETRYQNGYVYVGRTAQGVGGCSTINISYNEGEDTFTVQCTGGEANGDSWTFEPGWVC